MLGYKFPSSLLLWFLLFFFFSSLIVFDAVMRCFYVHVVVVVVVVVLSRIEYDCDRVFISGSAYYTSRKSDSHGDSRLCADRVGGRCARGRNG
ncbi:hypothetical protein EX30DRAFT_343051 [Ascodesmis nigricans]|uniref:Uncharacterized protein n=1 Tax=Ascodesmis nigricans TaxID=341454 RepID=A0A4S2MNG0_9PEZI|nr:hypothetical protein EX30DRAFT_343051 [Ascodesmis nigricans]